MEEIETISDDQLLNALQRVLKPVGHRTDALPIDPAVKDLLQLLVKRSIETGQAFNSHKHPVHGIRTESDYYHSAGSGWTSTPASDSGFGCEKSQQIGIKQRQRYEEDE